MSFILLIDIEKIHFSSTRRIIHKRVGVIIHDIPNKLCSVDHD